MKIPQRFEMLVSSGFVDDVMRQLMSGKEADVFVVQAKGKICCAKVYKDASRRSFTQQAQYQEGRKVKNSRQARAMGKGSRFGRKELEDSWHNAELESLQRLSDAGVRVPQVLGYDDGVLLMELVTDVAGNVAPRLNDVRLTEEQALASHAFMLSQIVRMLCVDLIHGDLSEYNVLVGSNGLVIIDLPQAIDATGNNNAQKMLQRDVENMAAYFGRFAPQLLTTDYGREIWKLYAGGELKPDSVLTGRFEENTTPADVHGVMQEIDYERRAYEQRIAQLAKNG